MKEATVAIILMLGASAAKYWKTFAESPLIFILRWITQQFAAQQLYFLRSYSWSSLFRFAAPSGGQLFSVAFLYAPTLFAVF
jgi:hypothetical protein